MGRSAKVYKKPPRAQRAASSASKAARAPLPASKPSKAAEPQPAKPAPQPTAAPLAPHKAAYAAALAKGIRTPRDAGVDYLAQWEGKSGKRKARSLLRCRLPYPAPTYAC